MFAIITTLVIPILGIMGFGPLLDDDPFDTSEIKYFNLVFKGEIDFIYYFTSFYIFLNISAVPVLIVVLRNNLINLITP